VRSEEDRRVIFVEVTETYREIQEETRSYALARFSNSISSLSQEELAQVIQGLNLLETALAQSDKPKD
jgi:DNA-binding MarR family transcriptional regulator